MVTLLVGGEEGRGVGRRRHRLTRRQALPPKRATPRQVVRRRETQRRSCSRRRQHRHDQWEFAVESGVASNGENPTLTLETGTRYVVENRGCSAHPFVLLNGNDTSLLTQMTAERSQTTPT